jgi:hypothetical protein
MSGLQGRRTALQTFEIAMAVATCTACGGADVRAPLAAASPTPPAASTEAAASGECTQTLAEHCGGPCPSYAEVVAQIRKSCGSVMRGFPPTIDHCPGVFDMTSQPGPFGGVTMYFDAQGTAIGAWQDSDANSFCHDSSITVRAGTIPECPGKVATEKPCAAPKAGPSPALTPGSHR